MNLLILSLFQQNIPQDDPDTEDNDDTLLDSDDELHEVSINDDKKSKRKSADWVSVTYEVCD